MEDQVHHQTGHETRDASVRAIVFSGIGLTVVLAVVGVIGIGMFQYLRTHMAIGATQNPMAAGASRIPPQPRLEVKPALGLEQLRTQEERILSTYDWADRKSGRVRIPVDRAMELQLQRGFPTRKEPVKK